MTNSFDVRFRTRDDTPDLSGQEVGRRYRLVKRLALGGVAEIYEALNKHTNGRIAIKRLRPKFHGDETMKARFTLEAQLSAQIHHPALIPAYDHAWEGGHFTVFQLVEGLESLRTIVSRGPLPWTRLIPILLDYLAALEALHARGIVHRDVSPDNCLVVSDAGRERGILADLGFALVLSGDHGLKLRQRPQTYAQVLYGVEQYMEPEMVRGEPASYSSDQFSVGAVMHYALSGVEIEDPRMDDEVLDHPNGPFPVGPLPRLPIPPALAAVMRCALDGRERRYPTAAAMAEALRAALRAVDRRRVAYRAGLIAASTLVVVGALGVLALPPATDPTPVASETSEPRPQLGEDMSPLEPSHADAEVATLLAEAEPVPPVLTQAEPGPPVAPVPAALPATAETRPSVKRPARPPSSSPKAREPASKGTELREALAKCKTHPSMRVEVDYQPGKPLLINGDPPRGITGHCVKDAIESAPPKDARTFNL